MATDRADEENLKATSFTKGEWGDEPTALAMDYDMVAETFGTAAAPLATMPPLTLLALAFVTGGLDHALAGRPDGLLTEAAITARGAQAAGGDAAANARATAMASCTSEVERMAVRLVEAKDGVMQLVAPLRELPLVQVHALNAQPFKRLARLANAHGAMLTARVTTTALNTALDDDTSTSNLPSTFSSPDAGLVPAPGGTSTSLFLSQGGTFMSVPPPAAPNLSAYVTTTALNTALPGYLETGDSAGGVTTSTSTAKIQSQSSNIKLKTGSPYTIRSLATRFGVGLPDDNDSSETERAN